MSLFRPEDATWPPGGPGRAIPAGQAPGSLAVSPGGRIVDTVGGDSGTLIPTGTGTSRPGRGIPVWYSPAAVAG